MKRTLHIPSSNFPGRISPKGWDSPYGRIARFIRPYLFESVRVKFLADLKIDIDFT
jgi:hypothetical protein